MSIAEVKGNMLDYLNWRGDLTFEQDPFNPFDQLLLSYISYANMDGAVCAPGEENPVTLEEAWEKMVSLRSEEELKKNKAFTWRAPFVLRDMAKTRRFGGLKLQNYVNEVRPEEDVQFAAVEILMEDGTSFLSFRGTDETLVGWKEDFLMSYRTVPAQVKAAEYTDLIMKDNDRRFYLGGHSKGGNLAVYAAARCASELQDRIIRIYDFDGPGFLLDFLHSPEYQKIKEKIDRIIPEESIIGTLMENDVTPVYLHSTGKGILQHDAFTWAMKGPRFEYAEKATEGSKFFEETFREWMYSRTEEQRKEFIGQMFEVFAAFMTNTDTAMKPMGIKAFGDMIAKFNSLSQENKETMWKLVQIFFTNIAERLPVPHVIEKLEQKEQAEKEAEEEKQNRDHDLLTGLSLFQH